MDLRMFTFLTTRFSFLTAISLFFCFMLSNLPELSNCFDTHDTGSPNLLLISLDGFRWDYIQKAKVPTLHSMIKDGAWSMKGLKNVFITKTFPNHFTLVTGLYEESHGIVGNAMYDPDFNETFHPWVKDEVSDPKWYNNGEEPIWVTNQLQSTQHRSGSGMWPGAGPRIKGVQPYRSMLYDETVSFRQRIDRIIEWFTDDYPINLGLLYFHEPDKCGHKFGPDSQNVAQMVTELDSDIGYLLDQLQKHGLLSNMNIILTSDHGMTSTPQDDEHRIDLNSYIKMSTYNIDTGQPIATLRPKSKELGEEILKNLSSIPHLHVYRKEDIPEEYHYKNHRRIDPILLAPDEHYWVAYNNSNGTAGNHGYNNSFPSMHPVFIAMGPSFEPGARVEQFSNVDVYMLMCELLDLKPAPNNGSLESVQYLLVREPSGDTSTFGIYMFILIFTGFISGVFGVAACRVHRQYKRRRTMIRSIPDLFSPSNAYTKIDCVPLMPVDSDDDEFDVP